MISEVLPGYEKIRRQWLPKAGTWMAQVLPGELYVTAAPELISTVLGSCVAVAACDPQAGVGGMNHFLLPLAKPSDAGIVSRSTRYGVQAMEVLLNALYSHGARREHLIIKAFGAGNVTPASARIGDRNQAFVLHFMEQEGLELQAQDLGGEHGRRVIFEPATGRVRVKRIPMDQSAELAERDQEHLAKVSDGSGSVGGDVDLF